MARPATVADLVARPDRLLDASEKVLIVHRWSPAAYTMVLSASSDEAVRAEPFDAVELRVAVLSGDDDDDE